MSKAYDLVIIGTGTAAMVASQQTAAAGWKVGVIDFRPFGGTCALRGCDPKKVLIGGATAIDHIRRMRGKGPEGDVHLDWPKLIAFKRSFTDPTPERNEHHYADEGIKMFHGRARFTAPNTIDIAGESLVSRYILIAAGAEPIRLGIPGEEHLATSEDFLALEQLPKRIVLVGGGFIAAEFSHIAARAGAEVTVLQRGKRMLPNFDPDLVEVLMEKFREIGVNVNVDTEVQGIEKNGSVFSVHATSDGQPRTFEAEFVVHAAGRAPALELLDLDAGGLAHKKGRLKLNEFLQSVSNPAVYAAGDAAQMGPPLTPVSSHDAKVVAANLLNGNRQKPNYFGVPSVAFTIPPIAAVGLSEQEARKQGLKFRMQHEKALDWYTARQAAESTYAFKVMVEEETDLILGAHLVGPHVDEVINIFALAIRQGLTAEAIKTTMFVYPSGASDIGYML